MVEVILPSGPGGDPHGWTPDHLRLHRSLLRQPQLLPVGAPLLLAVSGGQDSMAMTGLLRDLQPLHQWRLHLWHGDHGWRPESGVQAAELQAWARSCGLSMRIERQDSCINAGNREAVARQWRYGCLSREAQRLGCGHVLTAHTASDRAETVLLHLARGAHRRGLSSLRVRLPLESVLDPAAGSGASAAEGATPLWLVRPLQLFSREDTLRLCRSQGWPIWWDPSNEQCQLSRNRIRAEVLPVLEQLHPGAGRRISDQAERLAAENETQQELLDLALTPLLLAPQVLDRRVLVGLSAAVQAQLLQHWLLRALGHGLDRRSLAALMPRLPLDRGSGRQDLASGWQLSWKGTTLTLRSPYTPTSGHD